MRRTDIVYFDHAAAWHGYVPEVSQAVKEYLAGDFGNPGRGSHMLSVRSSERVYEVRERAARLFKTSPERVVFTQNTTYALNLAIQGCIKKICGEISFTPKVITSALEHNSVMRPLKELERKGVIELCILEPAFDGMRIDSGKTFMRFRSQISGNTCLVCMTVRSNLTGERVLTSEMARLTRKLGIPLIADGAQSAGHEGLDFDDLPADIICVPGHKGLMGTMSSGMMVISDDALVLPEPVISGGSGAGSRLWEMPALLPERLEAGTLPLLGIMTLGGGMKALERIGIEEIEYRERIVTRYITERLMAMKNITVYSPSGSRSQVLFNVKGRESGEVCELLENNGILVRGGVHCAPSAHLFYKTGESGVRASFSYKNSVNEAEYFILKLSKLLT
ncbi:MAG: aminotransferase class V-fold PLP-dependent enzyme [Ruminococcaceae bacterium]|nr:aminotransferase class V-fold PLP-dependent enzyme [Oscillospiraceae bacterium]